MDYSASAFDAGENKQEFPVEQLRVQQQLASQSSLQPVQSIEALVDQLVIRMRAIGEEYLERVHAAAIECMDRVDRSIESRFARRYESSVHLEIKNAENVFDGQIVAAAADMKRRHEMIREEIQTETLLLNEDIRIHEMIQDLAIGRGGLGC